MAKEHSKWVCQQCGYETTGWMGKCPSCDTWNSLVETVAQNVVSRGNRVSGDLLTPTSLASVKISKNSRISTKISELDRVLGGGIVGGQVILLAGEPGIGKSTLLLQLSEKLGKVLYVSGEESASQVAIRAGRLGVNSKKINFLETTDIDQVVGAGGADDAAALVVDSIQTMTTADLTGLPGSVGQVRECAFRLVRFAKSKNVPVFIVGHVTKEGSVAGPAVLAHIVDTVLWFEGDKTLTLRLLRAYKNRFGPTDEVGIFTMDESGLNSAINVDKLFLSGGKKAVPGSVVTTILEGTRPIMVEIQSLVVSSKLPFPKRVSQGFDQKRLELILAILQRRSGLPLYDFDVYINVVGGVTIKDPGADLAVCLSIASAYYDKVLPEKMAAIGEIDLLGEVREAAQQERRIKEIKRLGYTTVASNKETKYLNQAIKKYLQ